jgi:SAM-dependent methyltransferase
VGYFDWHEQPGYWADITRHFDPGARILDLGCGTGWMADHFPDYTGMDGSPDAVAIAQERGRNVILGNVDEPLPFPEASFGAVVIKDVLEHINDPVTLVTRARALLRPGGVLYASAPDAQRWVWDDYTHRRPFSRKAFRLLFADQGYDVVRVGYESVTPGIGRISKLTRRKRRPRVFAALALLPFHRRNVWILARRPVEGE